MTVRRVRCRGGNFKFRALRLDTGNFSWGSQNCTRKTRLLDVSYNSSNNELVSVRRTLGGLARRDSFRRPGNCQCGTLGGLLGLIFTSEMGEGGPLVWCGTSVTLSGMQQRRLSRFGGRSSPWICVKGFIADTVLGELPHLGWKHTVLVDASLFVLNKTAREGKRVWRETLWVSLRLDLESCSTTESVAPFFLC